MRIVRPSLRWVVFAVAALAGAGCRDNKTSNQVRTSATSATSSTPDGDADLPLAKVDGVTITVGELQERLNRQSPYVRARYTSLEQKKEFLDSLVRFEVLAKEAQRRGFDRDPEVVRTMKQVMIQKLMRDEFETKITPESIAADEIKAYYDAHLDEFVKQEEVRASAIVVKTRAQAERVAAEAAGEAGRTNKAFRDLVTAYSTHEETKLRGGDLRYMNGDNKDWPAPVRTAAFALANTGDVSGVVDAGDGTFWILKQTGRRKAMTRTLEDATQQIRNKLYREKRVETQKQFIAGLEAKAKIVIDEGNLSKVRIDTSTASGAEPHGDPQPLPDLTLPRPDPAPPPPGQPAETPP